MGSDILICLSSTVPYSDSGCVINLKDERTVEQEDPWRSEEPPTPQSSPLTEPDNPSCYPSQLGQAPEPSSEQSFKVKLFTMPDLIQHFHFTDEETGNHLRKEKELAHDQRES